VVDPNFAHGHLATFKNDGSTSLFVDERGGGGQARCTVDDPSTWDANAVVPIVGSVLELAAAEE